MKNSKTYKFWQKRYLNIDHNSIVEKSRHYINDPRILYDFNFLKLYISPNMKILDQGGGACIMANMLAPICKSVTVIDYQDIDYSKYIKHSNISYIQKDICDFVDNSVFDLIICLGVIIYIEQDIDLHNFFFNCKQMMGKNSKLIIRNQFGINKKVTVNKYSEELKDNYFAVYRTVEEIVELVELPVEIHDIYPKSCNLYQDTAYRCLIFT